MYRGDRTRIAGVGGLVLDDGVQLLEELEIVGVDRVELFGVRIESGTAVSTLKAIEAWNSAARKGAVS